MTASVVIVGSYNQDLVWRTARIPEAGETRTGLFSEAPGGKGFNQAMAAHRLGCTTLFIAACGADALGDNAQATAAAEGLDCRWQICPGSATGNAAIWLDADGQNRILVDLAANRLLSPEHIRAQADALQAARVVLAQQESQPAATREALRSAKAAGALCVLNPAPATGDCAALPALADVLTPNESEFSALLTALGEPLAGDAVAALPAEELHLLARRLPCPAIIITLGARGALLSQTGGFREFTPPAVSVRDSTGAGDCFNGALAAELAAGRPLADACAFAVKAASCKVERIGAALAMPTRSDIANRFG